MSLAPGDEPVEVVDADGRVDRVVTRAAMRADNLRHRATYIVVRNQHGDVLVHQRAPWKDIWPSRWDLAFGGICAVGESWPDAAARELAEESGLERHDMTGELTELGPVRFENDSTRVIGRVYLADAADPAAAVRFPDGEVVDHRWIAAGDLAAWADRHELCDDTAAVVLPTLLERL